MKKIIEALSVVIKIFLVVIIIAGSLQWSGLLAIKNVFTYHISSYYELSILKNYVMCNVNIPDEKANDYVYQHLLGEKCKKLFEQENKRDGTYILVENWLATRDYLRPEEQRKTLTDPSHEYFFINNFIKINSNYLKYNPIIDTNGKQVDMSWAENEDKMYALVPQKYQQYEENFIKSFKEYYALSYAIDRNVYLEDTGKQPEEIKERDVEIIYVKDNQKYINYYSYWGVNATKEDRVNFIPDPIALIVNPINSGNDTYLGAFSTGAYKVKKIDNSVDMPAYSDLFTKAGMEASDLNRVDDSYKYTIGALYKAALGYVIPILLVLLICFIQAMLYVKDTNNKNISMLSVLKGKSIAFLSFAVLTFGASFMLGYYLSVAAVVIAGTLLIELLFIFLRLKKASGKAN